MGFGIKDLFTTINLLGGVVAICLCIDGQPYWDGGIYSNTPIEAVLDDKPRQDSVIFTVHMWNPEGPEPASLWEVMGRQKDIQYASRAKSHIARQKQIHHLRHVIREMHKHVPEKLRDKYREAMHIQPANLRKSI